MRISDWSSDVCSSDLYGPITRFQACPPTCGAAAAILVSPAFAAKNGLDAPVEIVAQSMTTDYAGTFEGRSMMSVVGYEMAREAAREVYETAGIGPGDIAVVELHDCFAPNELIRSEEGRGGKEWVSTCKSRWAPVH